MKTDLKTLDKSIPQKMKIFTKAPDGAQFVMINSHHNPVFFKQEYNNQWWVRTDGEDYWRKSCSGEYWYKKGELVKIHED